MRLLVIWLTALLLTIPSFWITRAALLPVTRSGDDANHHLIVRFKPGVSLLPANLVQAQRVQFGNALLDELRADMALAEVERLSPDLPSVEEVEVARDTVAPRPPQSLEEAAAILHKYGQDRTVLLRFDRPINPLRLAQQLMRQYPDLIELAEPDSLEPYAVVPNDQFFNVQWHLQQRTSSEDRRADIRTAEAWDITTGSPDVVIAVIDSGLDAGHPDIANKIFINPGEIPNNLIDDDHNGFIDDVSGWDFVRRDKTPNDETGHGTWMAGIAAGATNNARDAAGVSWSSPVLPLKAGDIAGIYVSAQIQAINYAITMAPRGVRVINMSFGGSSPNQTREAALRAANEAGIVAIAAAGNGGQDGLGDNNDIVPHYPSGFSLTLDNVVAVAAIDRSNSLASFSNFGLETVDVGSPGVNVFGITSRDTSVFLGRPNGVVSESGTSPATAIVSGLAALIYSEFPDSTPLQVKQRLRGGVDRLPALLATTVSGGRVNAFRSLEHDEMAPASITDLRVVEGSSPTTLTWTATGDDGQEGQATLYEIRFMTTPNPASNFKLGQKVTGVPFPQPAGTTEMLAIPKGLSHGTYYFMIRVFDNVGNTTDSNQVQVTISG
ncbi:MAG: S8 family serine peptidase [Acidobacteria bacterium]|nr:S8 family serine peptidase [Acidobacteriota bacterium]